MKIQCFEKTWVWAKAYFLKTITQEPDPTLKYCWIVGQCRYDQEIRSDLRFFNQHVQQYEESLF